MSPDVFLSQNGIRYDGNGLNGSPADIMVSLVLLNGTRSWSDALGGFIYNRHETPGFISAPINPNTFSPIWVEREQVAVEWYRQAVKLGSLAFAWIAIDEINRIRAVKGGPAFTADTDFDILSMGSGSAAQTARKLNELNRNSIEESGQPYWFFTKAAYDAINKYASGK